MIVNECLYTLELEHSDRCHRSAGYVGYAASVAQPVTYLVNHCAITRYNGQLDCIRHSLVLSGRGAGYRAGAGGHGYCGSNQEGKNYVSS